MAEFIGYYYHPDRTFTPLTPELLNLYDVLILKIPTSPFSPQEHRAIVEFVRQGGGLFLLGEHTNVFGSGTYLNIIARQLGLAFRFDAIFDIEKKFVQLYHPPRLLPHPIVQNMPPFLFATSCSIEPLSPTAEPVILSTGLKSLSIDYASRNFYPQVKDSTAMRFGPFFQMMAVKAGNGRVAAFSDSTCFSNFSAFIPGKPEMLLATLDWLNRRNLFSWLNPLFLLLAGAAFLVSWAILRKGQGSLPSLIAWGAAAVAASLIVLTALNRSVYPLPRPHTEPVRVTFEQEHSDYELPLRGFTENPGRSFAVFYQWVLRLGYFPFATPTLEKALSTGKVAVIINPTKPFSSQDVEKVRGYLEAGGKLLLLDSLINERSTANHLLSPFGVELVWDRHLDIGLLQNGAGQPLCPVDGALPVKGGEPLLMLNGEVVASLARVGKGSLVVMSASGRFVDREMGGSESVTPDTGLLQVYALEFALLRGMVEDRLSKELSSEKLLEASG